MVRNEFKKQNTLQQVKAKTLKTIQIYTTYNENIS